MRVFCASLTAATLLAGALQVPAELANGLKAIVDDSVVTYEDVAARTDLAVQLLRQNDPTESACCSSRSSIKRARKTWMN